MRNRRKILARATMITFNSHGDWRVVVMPSAGIGTLACKLMCFAVHGMALLWMVGAMTGCGQKSPIMEVAGGDPQHGKSLIQSYGCAACHVIPGIDSMGSNVGPPLEKMALRAYVGGVLPNTPEDLVRWLRNPPAVDPRTAMPNLGVSEAEARDMAAYLYTLK
jgi:cytochrome c